MFAKVVLSIAHSDVDKIFDYGITDEMKSTICRGMRVLVPFGARNTKTEGYVIDISYETEVPINKIKYVSQIMDKLPIFSDEMIQLILWMKEKYYTTMTQCFQTVMPSGIKSKTDWIIYCNDREIGQSLIGREKEIYDYVINVGGSCTQSELSDMFGKNCYTNIRTLSQKGFLSIKQRTQRNDFIYSVKYIYLNDVDCIEAEKEILRKDKRLDSQLKLVELIEKQNSGMPLNQCKSILSISDSPIKSLLKKGLVRIEEVEQRRNSFSSQSLKKTVPLKPTEEQLAAIDMIGSELKKSSEKKPILIHGITGSGKTEIYMQIIERVLEIGKQAIVLVPEISLTPQIVGRFISRFGEKVSVTHSKMNQGDRYEQWKKARDNEISIMIGPRSAIFTPFSNLGVIIIDEEHEITYKSDTTPKYDAREVARKRCELTKSLLIMGSATPSVQTYYEHEKNEINLITLKKRAKQNQLPQVFIKDMRSELEEGNHSIFSRDLFHAITDNLRLKQQTMLFLNRRGFSTFVSCRKCGYVMTCENCNVSYTYHNNRDELVCHYCGKHVKNPNTCPDCGSKYIKYFGTGTQKVEAEVKKVFPSARVLRMDSDTTSKKNSIENLLGQFGKGEADILIGTQMIAKGHDFGNVTLVGIMAADLSLNNGDYRSAENTFQIITQVAGRAGRDKLKGKVYVQTYNPEHYSIIHAAKQDYESFYKEEIGIRKIMKYPPFTNILTVLLTGKYEQNVIEGIQKLKSILDYYNRKGKFQILGPSPANISKINKEYRWRLIVKCEEEERLRAYILYCIDVYHKRGKTRDIMVNISMNPLSIV